MLEHRDAFMETLRTSPDTRRRVFDALAQRYGQDFAAGRTGKSLYDALHAAVRDADVPGAVKEFEDRFLPLLDPGRSPHKVEAAEQDPTAAADHRDLDRGWIGPLCAVGVVVGALAFGLVVLSSVVAKPPTGTKPLTSHTRAPQPPAETPKLRAPSQVIRDVQDPPPER